jgi:L-ribulose-5-phosphate 4-epimerase
MLRELRERVWSCNLELPKNGLVKMTSGNVSGRDPKTNLVVIKPSGYSYERMKSTDMVVVDLDGKVVEGHLLPSVDTDTHVYVYRHRPDVMGIAHTHSPHASTFAALGQPIPVCLTAAAMLGGEIPLGDYVPIGGAEIGAEIVAKIGNSLAIIMQNHGVFTIGASPEEATKMAIEVEEIAKITHMAMLRGKPIMLTSEQIAYMVDVYKHRYGQSRQQQ